MSGGLITEGLGDVAGGSTGFVATGVVAAASQLTVDFAIGFSPTDLTGASANPANWVISGSGPVTVLAVNIVGSTIVLTTTPQTGGASYVLTIPNGMLSNGNGFLGPYTFGFTGVATVPSLVFARSIDDQYVDAFFDFPPDASLQPLNPANWTITSPNLAVIGVQQLTATSFRVQTAPQAIGQSYTLTFT
jgi:hypothetical protein